MFGMNSVPFLQVSPIMFQVTSDLQYGMNNGAFFIVYDKSENKPFQHRFIQNDMQKSLYQAHAYVKSAGIDLSWIAGDYLRRF